MVQGVIGGGTNYGDQSIYDILEDIKKWVEYTREIKKFLEDSQNELKNRGFWNNIPFNFQMTIITSISFHNTALSDFDLIINSIENSNISNKEVRLLERIGINAIDFNHEYGRTYKEESRWKKYGDNTFKIAENMYAQGRDYFVTLQDATNAANRLKDYINTSPSINNNIIQNISGNENIVAAINQGPMTINNINKDIIKEIELAISRITNHENIDINYKQFINSLLTELSIDVKNNKQNLESYKDKFNAFHLGAGNKITKIVEILGSFASLAAFFGISL